MKTRLKIHSVARAAVVRAQSEMLNVVSCHSNGVIERSRLNRIMVLGARSLAQEYALTPAVVKKATLLHQVGRRVAGRNPSGKTVNRAGRTWRRRLSR